jgi:hypothetical protein
MNLDIYFLFYAIRMTTNLHDIIVAAEPVINPLNDTTPPKLLVTRNNPESEKVVYPEAVPPT